MTRMMARTKNHQIAISGDGVEVVKEDRTAL